MRLFITGGTGFIGSHFINQALAAGHECLALRRTPESKPRIPLPAQPTWLDADFFSVPQSILTECDALVHLAAHSANQPYDTLENCLYWNVTAPLKLFRTAIEAKLHRIVVAGSSFEYGRAADRYEFIPPGAPLEPTQSYPASKAAASIAFTQLAIERNLRLSIHRIFQVYGEGEAASRLWPTLRRAATNGEDLELTSGNQIRDFVPVEKVASELLQALNKDYQQWPATTNIGTGEAKSLRQFVEEQWRLFGAIGQLKFGTKPDRKGEIARLVAQTP